MPFDLIHRDSAELEKYKDPERLNKEAVAFIGQVKQEKSDSSKIYLRVNPESPASQLLEFKTSDVVFAEDSNVISGEETIRMLKIWVKKGSVGLRLEPFHVADLTSYFDDFE